MDEEGILRQANPFLCVSTHDINVGHKYRSPVRVCAQYGAEKARENFTELHGLRLVLSEYHHIQTSPHIVVD